MITKEVLNSMFVYREEGFLERKKGIKGLGRKPHHSGYYNIKINGKTYSMHRVVYVYHHGEIPVGQDIDHVDRNKSNNRISNLRTVSHSGNMQNKSASKKSKCRIIGVCIHKRKKSNIFQAQIGVGKKTISLGYYPCPIVAHAAYRIGKKKYHTLLESKYV